MVDKKEKKNDKIFDIFLYLPKPQIIWLYFKRMMNIIERVYGRKNIKKHFPG